MHLRKEHLKNFISYFAQSSENRRIRLLLGTLIALVVFDGFINFFLVSHGLAREGNPLLQNLVGDRNFLIVKVVGALIA